MKRRGYIWMILFLVVALSLLTGALAARAEQASTGIDLVILMDSTKSMSDSNFGQNDKDYDRYDAAIMMINMCDAQQSQVALVPFTDVVWTGNGGEMFNRMLDISDMKTRNNLCESLLNFETKGSSSNKTRFGGALRKAYELLDARRQAGSQNQPVVLLLSDGVVDDGAESLQVADQLKNDLGCVIYSVFLSRSSSDASKAREQMVALAGTADTSLAEAEADYFRHGQSSDMKDFFSDIFAALIGSNRKTEQMRITGDVCEIPVTIPNGSIFETNLVFETALIDSGSKVEIFAPGSDKPITSSEMVYAYEKRTGKKAKSYDYYSVKLMNHPAPGDWKVRFKKASSVKEGTPITYDMLYNYEIQLDGSVNQSELYFNDALRVEAYFVQPDGTRSNDTSLYRMENGRAAIPAMMTIEKDGRAVLSRQMTNEQAECRYSFDLNLEDVRGQWGYGEYTVLVHAEGDTLYRDLQQPVTFTLVNRKPYALDSSEVNLTAVVDNIFGENGVQGEAPDVTAMFADDDGDALVYSCEITSEAQLIGGAYIQDGKLIINPRGGASGTASIRVTATDPMGESDEKMVNVAIESVSALIQNGAVGVNLETDAANSRLSKGGGARVAIHFDIDDAARRYIRQEDLTDKASVSFTVDGEPVEVQMDEATGERFCVIAFGDHEKEYDVRATVTLGTDALSVDPIQLVVKNHAPVTKIAAGALDKTVNIDEDGKVSLNLTDIFEDEDQFEGGQETLTWNVTSCNQTQTGPFWKKPVFGLLRLFKLKVPAGQGSEVLSDAADNPVKELQIKDTGAFEISLRATDADSSTAYYKVGINAESPRETMFCLIVYGVILALLILLVAILINKFVVHQPWPRTGQVGAKESVWRNKLQMVRNTKTTWDIGVSGRKPVKLSYFYGQAVDLNDPNRAEIRKKGDSIEVWPTTGKCFMVEMKGKNLEGVSVTVDSKDLKKVRRAKWRNGTTATITMRLASGQTEEFIIRRS